VVRIGVLTPHRAVGPEEELPAMAPGRVLTCVARVSDDSAEGVNTPSGLRALATSPRLDEAAETLGHGSLDAIAYASTSTAYAIGFDRETDLASRLSGRVGLPAVAPCASAVLALRVLGADRIALVHPPWFDAEENQRGTAYFESQGFDVVFSESAALPDDPSLIESPAVFEWTSRNVSSDAEAVVIGGTGFRAAGAIAALEAALDRPVLSANQVLLWNVLAEAGAAVQVDGYGRLFEHTAQPAGR
jgi:maleate isomerase